MTKAMEEHKNLVQVEIRNLEDGEENNFRHRN
jgi:hypothetical protein